MTDPFEVEWTKRCLRNAIGIREYLFNEFNDKEVQNFENLLKDFEKTVSIFPQIYPKSRKHPELRKAVLHKLTSVFYTIKTKRIVVIAMQDNRQEKPEK